MRTIYKYPIEVTDTQVVKMPAGARILCVQTQNDRPYLWALVDSTAHMRDVAIYVYGTGHEVTYDYHYVGTFQLHQGALVFHVFAGPTYEVPLTLMGQRPQ